MKMKMTVKSHTKVDPITIATIVINIISGLLNIYAATL